MGESRDFVSLDWVQDDIEQTLQRAQECFESYLADPADKQQLTACAEAVHKVHGSLEMAGLPGAMMLTDEIEALLNALVAGQVVDTDTAHGALARALVHLPPYFSKVLLDEHESPLLLVGPANQIRKLLDKDAISELDYFTPDLGAIRSDADQETVQRFESEAEGNLKKLRQIYQFALIGIIRNEDLRVNLGRISNTLARLQQLCKGAPVNQVWEIGSALIEGLINQSIELETNTIDILRGIDHEFKTLIEQGSSGLNSKPDQKLMTALLFSVGKCPAGSPHVDAIKHEYGLDQYKLSGDAQGAGLIAGPDKETIRSVVSALGEELERIKDTIDLYVRNEVKSAIDLGGLKPALNQIASTLVLLNLEAPRIVVQEQVNLLAECSDESNEIPAETLHKVAESLLYVEAELDSVLASISSQDRDGVSVHADAAAESVVAESLSSLSQAKETLQTFISNDTDFEPLRSVPGVLRAVYGGLSIIALPTAPQLVFACAQYVEDDILALDKVPASGAMDALAEIVSIVEIYLEDFVKTASFRESILEQAKQRIAGLGYPIEQSASINSETDQYDLSDLAVGELETTDGPDAVSDAPDVSHQEEETRIESAQVLEFPTSVTDSVPGDEIVEAEAALEDQGQFDAAESLNSELEAPQNREEPSDEVQSDSLIDDEILEIFIEEASEVFDEIDNHWPSFIADRSNQDALAEVRRAFHTLKGSGRMVGAEAIGELSWAVENMLNHLIEGSISANDDLCDLVALVRKNLPELLENFQQQSTPTLDIQHLIAQAERVIAGEPISMVAAGEDLSDSEHSATAPEELPVEEMQVAEQPDIESPIAAEEESLFDIFTREAQQHISVVDAFLNHAMSSDAVEISEEFYRALHTLKGSAHMADIVGIATVASAAESLAKKMRDAGAAADGASIELFVRAKELMCFGLQQLPAVESSLEGGDQLLQEIENYQANHPQLSNAGAETENLVPALNQWLQQHMESICGVQELFESYQGAPSDNDATIKSLLTGVSELADSADGTTMPELKTLLDALAQAYTQLDESQLPPSEALLNTLGGSHETVIHALDQLAATQEVTIDGSWSEQLARQLLDEREAAAQAAAENIADAEAESADEAVQASAEPDLEATAPVEPELAEAVNNDAAKAVDTEPAEALHNEPAEALDIEPAEALHNEPAEALDPELIAIFLEEVDEIFETVADSKQAWMDDVNNVQAVDQLQRALHTLKGSSRMAGITSVGDLAHELESIYEDAVAGRIVANPQLFALIHECDDQLVDLIGAVRDGVPGKSPQDLIARVRQFHASQLAGDQGTNDTVVFDTALGATVEIDAEALDAFFERGAKLLETLGQQVAKAKKKGSRKARIHENLVGELAEFKEASFAVNLQEIGDLCQIFAEVLANFEPADMGREEVQVELLDWLERIGASFQEARAAAQGEVMAETPSSVQAQAPTAASLTTTETVRVPAALLEQLVNLAGETSVSRSRIEQQVSNFGYAIDEIAATVERLREQLRRMEMETEAQIIFRQEQEGPEHEGFDPLEMDRYSRMQELSRSLVESVSDLFDLKDTLSERSRYTESILLQQARINTELQEGLMKTRMVPFSRLVARLRRVVRQVSGDVGKQVEFKLKNVDVELDRSLLEHMTAPLEHMLRNAVDHGVETPEQRKQQGKNEVGLIQLSLDRDGGDIVLTLTDDGAGVNIEKVRAKAIDRGLIEENAQLSDEEILQFILHAGFSTATEVTQISGRGVGMDVVTSEIKKLGGSIHIESEAGKGSRFIVRVPYTVTVNSALMVTVGDESFALPLSTIEGVVRVSPYELEEYYRENGPRFEYAGQQYDLSYLGDFVGHRNTLTLQNQALPLPVILIRTAESAVALQVDDITASREIVVKPLGPQLGAMPGMSGATILGDGRVVLILDMPAMIRARAAASSLQGAEDEQQVDAEVSGKLRVMVVDDSVTVRKVATRLLERHGMEVIVAKDGVEAMTKLQDTLPSIMLLDIEMPRMDGFELASLMRHDEGMSNVPIVMITSRTGEKHRERAQEIGVNKFMGKPFQEDDLLDAISALTSFDRNLKQVNA